MLLIYFLLVSLACRITTDDILKDVFVILIHSEIIVILSETKMIVRSYFIFPFRHSTSNQTLSRFDLCVVFLSKEVTHVHAHT
jgi:hypothetical protein